MLQYIDKQSSLLLLNRSVYNFKFEHFQCLAFETFFTDVHTDTHHKILITDFKRDDGVADIFCNPHISQQILGNSFLNYSFKIELYRT